MQKVAPFIVGYVSLKSELSLEELAVILSQKLFGGLEFGGKELEIHEEVPAIFLNEPILGLKVVLEGYSGFEDESHFTLSVSPWITLSDIERIDMRIDDYLVGLLKVQLKDIDSIKILEV
ncbi:hypothetical protein [Flavihumibacter sp. ZG627]|uniref:hypothetical protein n=1 Tax=Flavihumibacter sp. ZG627 TaxID=1463156 RepID=UPI0006949B07|nr:hypothetical protein [Flavihumibacter sp. ZG627]